MTQALDERIAELFAQVKCPQDCDNGVVCGVAVETHPVCCGRSDKSGQCCGCPDPEQVQVQVPEPCQWCHQRDEALALLREVAKDSERYRFLKRLDAGGIQVYSPQSDESVFGGDLDILIDAAIAANKEGVTP